ncbi:hypothetical protein GGS20DRAFT_565232 [Poronia punctata]|nr:hypothetical protein GGS20DRAFT_565232 [Poronia punctata]
MIQYPFPVSRPVSSVLAPSILEVQVELQKPKYNHPDGSKATIGELTSIMRELRAMQSSQDDDDERESKRLKDNGGVPVPVVVASSTGGTSQPQGLAQGQNQGLPAVAGLVQASGVNANNAPLPMTGPSAEVSDSINNRVPCFIPGQTYKSHFAAARPSPQAAIFAATYHDMIEYLPDIPILYNPWSKWRPGTNQGSSSTGVPVQASASNTNASNLAPANDSSRLMRIRTALSHGVDTNIQAPPSDPMAELCKNALSVLNFAQQLGPDDWNKVYGASTDFRRIVDANTAQWVPIWIKANAPAAEAAVRDELPPHDIKGYHNLYLSTLRRTREIREILAYLAREGHRTPRGTEEALHRLAQVMRADDNGERRKWVEKFNHGDLLCLQVFFVKLALTFSDPYHGPDSCDLLQLFVSQPTLTPLWELLMGHKYRTTAELLSLKITHDALPRTSDWNGKAILGIEKEKIGRGAYVPDGEGAPCGLRTPPITLVTRELVRRGYNLDEHYMYFALWGNIHWPSGRNITPSEAEINTKDYEYANRSIDTTGQFSLMHCKRARWSKQSRMTRLALLRAEASMEKGVDSVGRPERHDENKFLQNSDDARRYENPYGAQFPPFDDSAWEVSHGAYKPPVPLPGGYRQIIGPVQKLQQERREPAHSRKGRYGFPATIDPAHFTGKWAPVQAGSIPDPPPNGQGANLGG